MNSLRMPPKKRLGQGVGPRKIDGVALDVRTGSAFLGWKEKKTRGMIERGLLPYKRMNGRIILIRSELESWLTSLTGCSLEESLANMRARQGQ